MAVIQQVFRSRTRRTAVAAQRDPAAQEILVRIRGAYEPDTIIARAGRPLRITFRREETAPCSERVVFPPFGKSTMLPPFLDVTVGLGPIEAGEYEFTCQMGMLRGRLIVSPDGTGARASVPPEDLERPARSSGRRPPVWFRAKTTRAAGPGAA